MRNLAEAVDEMAKAEEIDPKNRENLELEAAVSAESGKFDEALNGRRNILPTQSFRPISEIEPSAALPTIALINLGESCRRIDS